MSYDTVHPIFTAQSHRDEPCLYIGRVAELTGASRKAIRHYESLGLIPKPQRRGNYRIYSERDIFLIHMIKHAQSFGFSLKELRELIAAKIEHNQFPLELANDLFDRKRTALHDEINALVKLGQKLEGLRIKMNHIFG